MWEISNPREPIWRKTPYTQEIQCIDWSPDGKWIATAARDGSAYLHDAENGNVATELHTLLLVSTGDDRYRFRSLKFIPGKFFFQNKKNARKILTLNFRFPFK